MFVFKELIAPQTHLNLLLLMQKKIIGIMTYASYHAHTAPIFRDLEISTIDKLIVHRIEIVMHKFNNEFLPKVLNAMYRKNSEIHSYNTRNKDIFRSLSGTQTFSNISARIWNSLVINLDINVSLTKFEEYLEVFSKNIFLKIVLFNQ